MYTEHLSHVSGYILHDSCKHERCCVQTKEESFEVKNFCWRHGQLQVPVCGWVNQYMQVCVLQIFGASLVLWADSCAYRQNCCHLEVWTWDVHIQVGNVENRSVGPVWFRDQKHACVKRCMVKLRPRDARYGPLHLKGCNLLQQTQTERQIVRQSERNRYA